MHHALYVKCRGQAERESSPTAAIIDAQSGRKEPLWLAAGGVDHDNDQGADR
jgi:hypothetical protein